MMILRAIFLLLFLGFFVNPGFSQGELNQITSVKWENNFLLIEATNKISYAEARLKDPDRLVIDLLNCTLQSKSLEKSFRDRPSY